MPAGWHRLVRFNPFSCLGTLWPFREQLSAPRRRERDTYYRHAIERQRPLDVVELQVVDVADRRIHDPIDRLRGRGFIRGTQAEDVPKFVDSDSL